MSRTDWYSVLRGAAIAVLPALLTFIVDAASGGALGAWGLAIAPLLSIVANAIRKAMFPTPPTPGPDGPPSPEPDEKPESVLARLLGLLFRKKDPPSPPTPPAPWMAALLAVLVLGGSAMAEVRIVGELKVPEHRIVRLSAAGDVDGAALVWDVDREDAVDVVEIGGQFLLVGPPGTYKVKVRAFRSKDGKLSAETARAVITIGAAPPPGPVPPGPNPPVPPGPDSQLVKDLRAAFAAEAGTAKVKQIADLAAVYREVAAKSSSPDLKTAGDLLTVLRTAVGSLVPADALVGVRKRVAVEVSATLPSDPTVTLDTTTRQKAAEVFTRVASALEVIAR